MKDIENALKNEYPKAARTVAFDDTSKLSDLYGKCSHHTDAVGKIVVRRAVAIAACAALFLVTTTAVALTRPDRLAEIRDTIAQHLGIKGASDEKIDDLALQLDEKNASSEYIDKTLDNAEINSYGEIIGISPFSCDLFKVAGNDEDIPTGYVYRYDLGIVDNVYLTKEEYQYYSKDESILKMMTGFDDENGKRGWVYAFDKEGMEIVGKYSILQGFHTNKQLKDPEAAKLYSNGASVQYYDKFVQDRIQQKKDTGEGFRPPREEYTPPDLPTDNLDMRYYCICSDNLILSDNAYAVSSDPTIIEVDEIVSIGTKTDKPISGCNAIIHKTGTAIITLIDGDNEYQYECTLFIGSQDYEYVESRIK